MQQEYATSMEQLESFIDDGEAVMVVFSKDQCAACSSMDNWLENNFLQRQTANDSSLRVVKAKLEAIGASAVQDFGLRTMPTTVLFKGGDEVYRVAGFNGPAPVEAAINTHLK